MNLDRKNNLGIFSLLQKIFWHFINGIFMIENSSIESIYVIHAKKGYELHENRVKSLFKKNNLDFEFVTDGDPSLFTKEILNKYFINNIESKISKGVISCTLNHFYAYIKMIEKNEKYAIIFENDPFFIGDFMDNISKRSNEIQNLNSGFIISIENSTLTFPSIWQTEKNKHIYPASKGRMAGAYIIDLQGAKNIINDLKDIKCNTVIDWWHNNLIKRNIIKMYWLQPAIVEQGSHNGLLSSTISTKSKSKLRRLQWITRKLFKMYIRRLFNEKRILPK